MVVKKQNMEKLEEYMDSKFENEGDKTDMPFLLKKCLPRSLCSLLWSLFFTYTHHAAHTLTLPGHSTEFLFCSVTGTPTESGVGSQYHQVQVEVIIN